MVDSTACETECGPTRLPVGGLLKDDVVTLWLVGGDWLGRCDRGLYGERTGKVLHLSLNTLQSCRLGRGGGLAHSDSARSFCPS